MSRSKKLYILLGVLVVACVATLAVTQIAEHKEQIKNRANLSWSCPATPFKPSPGNTREKLWRSTGMRHGFMTRTRSFR